MNALVSWFTQFNEFAKGNPLAAGLVSVWGLGVLTFVCRGVPLSIWRFVKRQCTTSLTFNNMGVGTSMETFGRFLEWFEKTRWAKLSRSMSLTGSWGHDVGTVLGPGTGSHLFFYKGRPFWMTRTRLQNTNFQIVDEIQLTALGRNRQVLMELVEEFRFRPQDGRLSVYGLKGGDWTALTTIPHRPIETVVVHRKLKERLLHDLKQWRDSKDWYAKRGLPYKLTCILHGPPGTGKTSLIKALASHFGFNIATLNLAQMSDTLLERALSTAPRNSIIVIEDFDSSNAVKSRRGLGAFTQQFEGASGAQAAGTVPASTAPVATTVAETISQTFSFEGLTLSGLLNALDGVVGLDEKVVFLTTNVYNSIDPALLRKGRVDCTFEVPSLTHDEVCEYVHLMFPETSIPASFRFADILGCDLQDLYFQHRHSGDMFVNAVPHQVAVLS